MKNSKYSGFYKLTVDERLNEVKEFANLSDEQTNSIKDPTTLDINRADNMIENVIGRYTLPMGVALNFLINGKDYLIPMVTEEPSVIAAASNGAKVARSSGGFKAFYVKSNMIAQVQVTDVLDCNYAKMQILENKDEIIKKCNECDPTLVRLGGGAFDIDVRILRTLKNEELLIVHLKVNTLDAMGANTVNTMAESVAPYIEELTGGKVYLRILTNLATDRLVRASVKVKKEELGGEEVVDKIVSAVDFAFADPYRAATHNKGIMNGISAAVMATGNDTRAIESGAHAYASITGQYLPLTTWEKNKDGDLVGTIEIPKTKLKCTILSEVTKRSIEIGVGKIYTTSGLNQPGTTVIYGHNYRNSLFFSKNKELTNGDKIYILDQTGTKLTYEVYNSFETTSTDTSFYTNTDTQGKAEIVLSTCTDDASTTDKRFIIQAREVD